MKYKEYMLDSIYMETKDTSNDKGWYYIKDTVYAEEMVARLLLLGGSKNIGTKGETICAPVGVGHHIEDIMYIQIGNSLGTRPNYKLGIWQVHIELYREAVGETNG